MEPVTAATPESAAPAAPVQNFEIGSLTAEQRSHWQATGEWPSKSSDAAPSEPATPAKAVESEPTNPSEVADKATKTAPESEPGKIVEEHKAETPEERSERDRQYQARRNERLNRENKRLKAELAGRQSPAKPESAPGPASSPRPNWDTWEGTAQDFQKADEAWVRADERRKAEVELQQKQKHAETQKIHQTWGQKVEKFLAPRSANPEAATEFQEDFDHVADSLDGTPADRVLSELTTESDTAPAMIQYLADNPKELQELRTAKTFKAAALIIDRIETALANKVPPTRKLTRASNPTSEVAGRDSTTLSPEEAAFRSGNTAEYNRLMNAKDLKARGR